MEPNPQSIYIFLEEILAWGIVAGCALFVYWFLWYFFLTPRLKKIIIHEETENNQENTD